MLLLLLLSLSDDAGGEVKGSTCLESSFSWRDFTDFETMAVAFRIGFVAVCFLEYDFLKVSTI